MKLFHIPRLAIYMGILLSLGVIWFAIVPSSLAQGPPPPDIPHTLVGREDCLSCHADESNVGIPQMPEEGHDWHTSNSCQKCHDPVANYAPDIPHTLEGRENCLNCHLSEDARELAISQSTTPLLPVPTPVVFPVSEAPVDNCVACHLADSDTEHVVTDWQSSIHAERGVVCASCHGGNPAAESIDEAKTPETGYIGRPDRTTIPALCGSCHADVTLMRQYDLPTDQYAKYQESQHGQLLVTGDAKVATCFDCHDGHATREVNDPLASVYRFNVPALCAGCHADVDYMADYDIPIDQYALFEESVHGIALLNNQDIRAPNCATCHGTHGAAPPGFSEVANVCGSCHSATQDYFVSGPHNSDDPEAPRCVTCHGRYDVQEPSHAMFEGDEPRHCGSCHAPNSEVGSTVAEIYQSLVDADTAYAEAQETVEQAAALGMLITEEENLLSEAYTRLTIAEAAQHTASLSVVQEETNASIEMSTSAETKAEEAIGENHFRRQAMVVALGVIGLIILSLVWLRRDLIARRRG